MIVMGNDKQSTESSGQSQSQQQYTPSAEEKELQQIMLRNARAMEGPNLDVNKEMTSVVKGLLTGGASGLPDVYNKLFGGIDESMIRELAGEAIADITPGFQKSGILDSGVAASIAGRTAGDIRRNVAENNLTRVFNLLQTGLGYGGQQQQAASSSLSGLAGLVKGTGTTNTTGSFNQMSTTTSMNPFLKSFQQSLGSTLGSPKVAMGTFSFGG